MFVLGEGATARTPFGRMFEILFGRNAEPPTKRTRHVASLHLGSLSLGGAAFLPHYSIWNDVHENVRQECRTSYYADATRRVPTSS